MDLESPRTENPTRIGVDKIFRFDNQWQQKMGTVSNVKIELMIKVIIMQDVSGMWRKQTDRLFLTFARPCEIARQVNINMYDGMDSLL